LRLFLVTTRYTYVHKLASQNRSDVLVKYFAERVAPAVHDVAARKEGFGVWKADFLHRRLIGEISFGPEVVAGSQIFCTGG
jgi:hypothetical protein